MGRLTSGPLNDLAHLEVGVLTETLLTRWNSSDGNAGEFRDFTFLLLRLRSRDEC